MRWQRLRVHLTSGLFIWNAKVGQSDSGGYTVFIVLALGTGRILGNHDGVEGHIVPLFGILFFWRGWSHGYSTKQEEPVSQDFSLLTQRQLPCAHSLPMSQWGSRMLGWRYPGFLCHWHSEKPRGWGNTQGTMKCLHVRGVLRSSRGPRYLQKGIQAAPLHTFS